MRTNPPNTFMRMDALRTILGFHADDDAVAAPYDVAEAAGLLEDVEAAGPHGHVLIVTAELRDTLMYALRNAAALARFRGESPSPADEIEGINAMLVQLGGDPERLPTL